VGALTSEQINAITYAYLDVSATDKFLNRMEEGHIDRRDWDEIAEAVPQTRQDLENAFPFLLEDKEQHLV
jgi:hypothetical protein